MLATLKKQAGFGMILVEVMLGAAALGGMLYLRNSQMVEDVFVQKAENVGQALNRITDATNAYLAANYEILTDAKAASDVSSQIAAGAIPAWKSTVKRIGDPVGLDYNLCADHQCVGISVSDLKTTGFLNPGMPDTNSYGSSYTIIVRRSGAFPEYNLDALVTTTGTIVRHYKSEDPWLPDIAVAADKIGADGAVVRLADANDAAGGFPAAGVLGAFGAADKQNGKLGWWDAATQWPNITMAGQIAARAGYMSSQWASYLRRDGTLPMTGNLNMGGNTIGNLKPVALDAPCDPDPGKAKLMSGQLATFTATNLDVTGEKLGSGFLLVCGYDQVKQGYIWKKATAGITGVDEAMAGMMDGYETGADYVCWGDPDGASATNNVAKLKFAMYQGKVLAFRDLGNGAWKNVTGAPGGYDLNVDYSAANNAVYNTNYKGYNWIIMYDPAVGYYCNQGNYGYALGDPNLDVVGNWYFGPNGIIFQVAGKMNVWGGADASGTMGGIPVSATGSVPSTTCSTDAFGVQTCSSSNVPITVTGQTISQAGNRVTSQAPVKQTGVWTFQRRTRMNLPTCATQNSTCTG